MKLSFLPLHLEFKRAFSIAHGSRTGTPVVFVKLEQDRVLGYGEASMPPYLGETHETACRFLEKAARALKQARSFSEPEEITLMIDKLEPGNHAAKASVDIAVHDLWGKLRSKPCHELFGAPRKQELYTAYTIPIDNPEGIRQRLKEASDYKILKVKLGSESDNEIIEEIRRQTDKELLVDANEGWTDKQIALRMLHRLAEKKVTLAEQPMPREMKEETAWLAQRSPIPLLADEAVHRLGDLEKAIGVYSGINIKLMKCTGLVEARKMIGRARNAGMKIMLGCMSESSCGVSAAAQLAPFADWIDLDGPLLIKKDYFKGVEFFGGKIILNDALGIGAVPIDEIQKRWILDAEKK